MTLAELCLPAAVLLYLLTIGAAKAAAGKAFDNAAPRDPAIYAKGFCARAQAAQNNGIEAVPLFVAAVLLAEFRGVRQPLTDALAIAFLAARLAYVGAYLANKPTLRSVIWSVGFAVNLVLFLTPWWARG